MKVEGLHRLNRLGALAHKNVALILIKVIWIGTLSCTRQCISATPNDFYDYWAITIAGDGLVYAFEDLSEPRPGDVY